MSKNDYLEIHFSIDPKYVQAMDDEIAKGFYSNRSELLRDIVRSHVEQMNKKK